ncbi:hypothetical protein E2C01_053092 [Portunus trituberculatus]|uniref:Uncharacterized protein n=1 Tax=Portunus trituberculatus TaxID=210409 RepID=A0A5B7GPE5_PORTR|nr:hypothetical protein [Portunus trituberculatus]
MIGVKGLDTAINRSSMTRKLPRQSASTAHRAAGPTTQLPSNRNKEHAPSPPHPLTVEESTHSYPKTGQYELSSIRRGTASWVTSRQPR